MTNWRVPYFDLRLGDAERAAVREVLDSNWLTTGPRIEAFERAFAERVGVAAERAVAVTNCTAGLHLALVAAGVGPEDEVICPSLTFVATVNAIAYCGATPVFADIISDGDLTIDPADVAVKVTSRTKALLPMHYGGFPCRMTELGEIARAHGLKIVEDAAHAAFSRVGGIWLGTGSDAGCFSFFSNKNLATGEGGMIVAADADQARHLRTLRSHGMTSSSYDRFQAPIFGYDVGEIGFNYRMDEMRAALGLAQLAGVDGRNGARRKVVERYRRLLAAELPDVVVPFRATNGELAYHIFCIVLPEREGLRPRVMARLAELGIQTSYHYRPAHTFTAYAGRAAQVPRTDGVAERLLSLPLYPGLGAADQDLVIAALGEALAAR